VGLGEARVLEAKAAAVEKQGTAEANVIQLKAAAEAKGITDKASAMKDFHEAGREHEEFKLRLNKEKDIELAEIHARQEIASSQAHVMAEAVKHATIEIVGGDAQVLERITGAVAGGKALDKMVHHSSVLTDIKETFFNGDPDHFRTQLRGFIDRFGLSSEDLKNLTVAAVLGQMISAADDGTKGPLGALLGQAKRMGVADKLAATFGETTAKRG